MNVFVLALLSGVGLWLALRSANKEVMADSEVSPFSGQFMNTSAGKQETTLDQLYRKHAAQNGLEPELVKAIAIVESNQNPNAVNPTDPSIGLMQVLARQDGSGKITNTFFVDGWPPVPPEKLFNPDYNLHIGCQILSWNIETYGFKKGIAVYNRWASRHDPADGPFGNQEYVNKVMREYAGLRATGGGVVV